MSRRRAYIREGHVFRGAYIRILQYLSSITAGFGRPKEVLFSAYQKGVLIVGEGEDWRDL